jgi:solute carrier family 6 GABA transporter-like protein 1
MNIFLDRFWYLAFYSVSTPKISIDAPLTSHQGNQLRRDLNLIVGGGKNWAIPSFLPFLLRYISGPVLAIIFSFASPEFRTLRYDPMMIAGFILSHICLVLIVLGFVMPRYYDVFIPPHRRGEGTEETVVNETKDEVPGADAMTDEVGRDRDGGEAGFAPRSTSPEREKIGTK